MPEPFECAVCSATVNPDALGSCRNCGWEGDPVQEDDPDYSGGANWVSLYRAKDNYAKHGSIMTPKDNEEKSAFYKAHVAADGSWIE